MNKQFRFVPKARRMLAAVPAGALALATQVHAAVPAGVTDAIGEAGTDTLTVAGIITGVLAALWAALLIKRKFFG